MKYNFHDSLIEKADYLFSEKKVEIIIELCNWQQTDYKDSDPEMLTICMVFDGVEKYEISIENYKFDSNEILDFVELDDRTTKIVFLAENDAATITVVAGTVSCTIVS